MAGSARRSRPADAVEAAERWEAVLEQRDGPSSLVFARLHADGIPTAVVSMPCWELFDAQDDEYRSQVLGRTARVAVEAALRFGWDRWLGERGGFVGMSGFGASGPAEQLYEHFGITPAAIVAEAKRGLTLAR